MPGLRYPTEEDTDLLIAACRDVFPESPSFVLQGNAGAGRLSSAFAQPHWLHHRGLPRKAAVLHYHINRDHPFLDGNKRFAIAAMEMFLLDNGTILFASNEQLFEFSLSVASGEMNRDESIEYVSNRTAREHWSAEQILQWLGRLNDEDRRQVLEAGAAFRNAKDPLHQRMTAALNRARRRL